MFCYEYWLKNVREKSCNSSPVQEKGVEKPFSHFKELKFCPAPCSEKKMNINNGDFFPSSSLHTLTHILLSQKKMFSEEKGQRFVHTRIFSWKVRFFWILKRENLKTHPTRALVFPKLYFRLSPSGVFKKHSFPKKVNKAWKSIRISYPKIPPVPGAHSDTLDGIIQGLWSLSQEQYP